MIRTGRHFLQIPGPTNVPDRILRAMDRPVTDHRSQEFARLSFEVLEGLRAIFQTSQPVIVYPSSGTGAWEAAVVNTLNPGDRALMFETGHFSMLWKQLAEKLGINIEYIAGPWSRGADATELERRLRGDVQNTIKAVLVVHNETSTGVTSRIPELRKAIDDAGHSALLMVDVISSLASTDYRHDEWQVDVAIGSSQKGLMLPPGLSFNAISEKALRENRTAKSHRSYWDWQEMLKFNGSGFFPYTPATNLLYGLREAIAMLNEEGLENVFRRHQRHGQATRSAVGAWGLKIFCERPHEYSNSVTAVVMPEGYDADDLRSLILDGFDMSLGAGLSKLAGRVFRIGHLGSFNDLMLAGTLCGVEMGMQLAKIPYQAGGVMAALRYLTSGAREPQPLSSRATSVRDHMQVSHQ
jgi:alanine-glyoxylate transaminase/serine-glyoxylate transaminase/serine-pyruvate transaminase